MGQVNLLGNFMCDSEYRLAVLKLSLASISHLGFSSVVMNVRGVLAEEAISLIKQFFPNSSCFSFSSRNGWCFDTRLLLSSLPNRPVLLFIEDHLFVGSDISFAAAVEIVDSENADFLIYSWHDDRFFSYLRRIGGSSRVADIDVSGRHPRGAYALPLQSIFGYAFFDKLLKLPAEVFPRFSIYTPFNLEFDVDRLCSMWEGRFRVAFPENELFACLDEDNGVEGYSLLSRGKAPGWVRERKVVKISTKDAGFVGRFERLIEMSLANTWVHELLRRFKIKLLDVAKKTTR